MQIYKISIGLLMLIVIGCTQMTPGYNTRNGKIFYYGGSIEESEIINKLNDVDISTFRVSKQKPEIAFDKNHVYCRGKILGDADPITFTLIPDTPYVKDTNNVYRIRAKFGDCSALKIKNIDVSTFEVINDYFIRDSSGVFFENKVVTLADPNTFNIVPDWEYWPYYGKDTKYVYYKNDVVAWANPSTFKRLDKNSSYYVDDSNVYTGKIKIEGADPKTFQILPDQTYSPHYAKDKNNVYFGNEIIDSADPDTIEIQFETWDDSARDKKYFYWRGKIIETGKSIDMKTWRKLGDGYFADKNNVYFSLNPQSEYNLIEAADVNSFEALSFYHAKDKNYVYSYDIVIPEFEPEGFKVLFGNYIKDNNTVLCKQTSINEYEKIEGADAPTFVYDIETQTASDKFAKYESCKKLL